MDQGTYPPTGQFRTLTRAQQAERLDVTEDLLANVQWWRGDPRLSAWQEGFLASMAHRLSISEGGIPARFVAGHFLREHGIRIGIADDQTDAAARPQISNRAP